MSSLPSMDNTKSSSSSSESATANVIVTPRYKITNLKFICNNISILLVLKIRIDCF